MNSFLRFKATVVDADQDVTPDYSADNFSQNIEILHAGNVLETIDS